ncbi:MAG: 3-methyl-2-oxobutanoate hydroxymethyltransferase, partial [Pontibacterium sp.]
SVDDMAYHTRAVAKGNQNSFIIADMPFMSYSTPELAMDSAAALMAAGAHMVKLEGGAWLAETVSMLAERGIPVCSHLGLTPQAVNKLGGYRVQGRDEESAQQMLSDAKLLEECGASMLLLECVPTQLAAELTKAASVPVVGIGAGPYTDAQVLVMHDMLGLNPGHTARFVKNFMTGHSTVQEAFKAYGDAVRDGSFPAPEHCFE